MIVQCSAEEEFTMHLGNNRTIADVKVPFHEGWHSYVTFGTWYENDINLNATVGTSMVGKELPNAI